MEAVTRHNHGRLHKNWTILFKSWRHKVPLEPLSPAVALSIAMIVGFVAGFAVCAAIARRIAKQNGYLPCHFCAKLHADQEHEQMEGWKDGF